MAPNLDAMVREAISDYRAGRKDQARTMLMRAVELDPYHEQAWLWLSAVVESTEEQRTCLENVLTINPNNDRAKQGLQVLSQKANTPPKQQTYAQADDVLASTSFGAPAAKPQANPFGANDDEELPDSILDDDDGPVTASSSASSNYKVNEPSAVEYDNWVSGLNLGGTPNVVPGRGMDAAAEFISGTPFDEDDNDNELNDNGDLDLRSMLGSDLDVDLDAADDDDDDIFSPMSPAASAPPKRALTGRAQPPPRTSPGGGKRDSLLDDIEEDDDVDAAFIDEDDFDDDGMDKLEAAEMFQYIPSQITATRMPGSKERYPALTILGMVVVLGLNVAAVALFISQMTSG